MSYCHVPLKFCIRLSHLHDLYRDVTPWRAFLKKMSLEQMKTSGFNNTSDCINKMLGITLVTSSYLSWFCVQKEEMQCLLPAEFYNMIKMNQVLKIPLNWTRIFFFPLGILCNGLSQGFCREFLWCPGGLHLELSHYKFSAYEAIFRCRCDQNMSSKSDGL